MRPLLLLTGILLPLLPTVPPAYGQSEIHPIATLAPSDVPPPFGTDFGASVAVWGDWIAIGAPADPWYNGDETGAVYVFRRVGPTWIQQAKLTDPDGTWLDKLGYSVAMEGDVIVAGAPHFERAFICCGGPGAVYVFRRDDQGTPHDLSDDTWFQEARLTAPDPQMGDTLGVSVAISGDTIVAGNWGHSKAEVFRHKRDRWVHEATLDGTDPDLNDFGFSVDIDGDLIVGGAFGQDDLAGAAYVFRRDEDHWIKDARIKAGDTKPWDLFGWSVAIDGPTVLIGAPYANATQGAAYLFTPTNSRAWKQQIKLAAPPSHEFGFRVALDADLALVINTSIARADLFQQVNKVWVETENLLGFYSPYELVPAIQGKYAVISTRVYAVRERVGLQDFARFENCLSNVTVIDLSPSCQPFDLTADERVELDDFEQFMGTFAGP